MGPGCPAGGGCGGDVVAGGVWDHARSGDGVRGGTDGYVGDADVAETGPVAGVGVGCGRAPGDRVGTSVRAYPGNFGR